MTIVVMDLEWNGAFSKKAHGYFNEIIEIGAVKLDESLRETETLRINIRPVISRKLTALVTDMTGITEETLEDGVTFDRAMKELRRFIGDQPVALLTWSTTDLRVLLEDFQFFQRKNTLPFITWFMDAQQYFQQRMALGTAQQIGLGKACELVGIDVANLSLHRAWEDAGLTAELLRRVYDKESFEQALCPMDEEFYARLLFKPYYINDPNSPLLDPKWLQFCCEECALSLERTGKWRAYNRALTAEMICRGCQKKYIARVQARKTYDKVQVKRKLMLKASENKEEVVSHE